MKTWRLEFLRLRQGTGSGGESFFFLQKVELARPLEAFELLSSQGKPCKKVAKPLEAFELLSSQGQPCKKVAPALLRAEHRSFNEAVASH